MQPHILEERKNIDFDFLKFKEYVQGGPHLYKRKMSLLGAVSSTPEAQIRSDFWNLSTQEKLREMFRQAREFIKLSVRVNFKPDLNDLILIGNVLRAANPFLVHYFLFIEAIKNLSTEEQSREWIRKSEQLKILGTYAQTELSHGSDIQHLETTATFDKSSDQIIIHTPKLQAAKFWPGELAFIANYALVMANLKVNGKSLGQHFFLVPIRSEEDHSLLPGIQTGEIGPKHGWPMKENGYAIFTQVRIPRTNMLMRFQELDSGGNYKKKGNPKILYIQMLTGRILIVEGCLRYLARALIIAFRYCSFRTQFKTLDTAAERKVLDYQLVQFRLIPYLSNVFAYFFAQKKLMREYATVKQHVLNNEPSELGQLHAIVSSMKAFTSLDVHRGVDQCRECCGGHGTLKSTGLSHLEELTSPFITLQGENAVMAQQTARDLLKNYQKAFTGKKTSSITRYLEDAIELTARKAQIKSDEDLNQSKIEEALKVRACFTISQVAQEILQKQQDGEKLGQIWNTSVQSDLIRAARYHCELFNYTSFISEIQSGIESKEIQDKVAPHLSNLAELYGIQMLVKGHDELYFCGYFESDERTVLKQALKQKIMRARKTALGLAEAFNLNEDFLHTTIGSVKRNPYEALMEEARKYNNKSSAGFMKYIKPLMGPKL